MNDLPPAMDLDPQPVSEPDDEVEASRMSLVDHLTELRLRLIRALIALFLAFGLCFLFADHIFNILLVPYERAVGSQQDIKLIFTAPQEYFFTQMKLALFGGLFLSFPIIAIQLYKFIAPGLYRDERRAFLPYLLATPVLFVAGAMLVYYLIMPLAMAFFLSLEQTGGERPTIQLMARTTEYLSLITTLIFAFGFVFQLPVVLTLLARVNMITSQALKAKRRYAIVIVFAVAAILTPPDPISQIGLALPTLLLYELSILCVRMIERKRANHAGYKTDT